eukprot:2922882-Ditylum_brightwellii.AAC.1
MISTKHNVQACAAGISLVPVDASLHESAMLNRMVAETLNQLEKEGPPPNNMKYLDAMLLCIVSPQ